MFQVEITEGGNFWGTRKWKQAVVRSGDREWVLYFEETDYSTSYTITGPGTENWRPKLKRLSFDALLGALLEFIAREEKTSSSDPLKTENLEALLRPDNPNRPQVLKELYDKGLLRFPRS
jgi:hypothetical protein